MLWLEGLRESVRVGPEAIGRVSKVSGRRVWEESSIMADEGPGIRERVMTVDGRVIGIRIGSGD